MENNRVGGDELDEIRVCDGRLKDAAADCCPVFLISTS